MVLRKLREELERYRPGLAARPSLVWINKADVDPVTVARAKQAVAAVLAEEEEEEGHAGVRGRRRRVPIMVGSAKTGERIGELAAALRMTLADLVGDGDQGTDGSGGGAHGSGRVGGVQGGDGRVGGATTAGSAEAAQRELVITQLASATAAALDAMQAHQEEWGLAMSAAVARVHQARCFAAAYEVLRRQNVWLGWSMSDVVGGEH